MKGNEANNNGKRKGSDIPLQEYNPADDNDGTLEEIPHLDEGDDYQ